MQRSTQNIFEGSFHLMTTWQHMSAALQTEDVDAATVWWRLVTAEGCQRSDNRSKMSPTSTSLLSFSMNFSFCSSLTYTFCMLFLKSMSLKVGSSFPCRVKKKSFRTGLGLGVESQSNTDAIKCPKMDISWQDFYPFFVTCFTGHQRALQEQTLIVTHH